MVFLRGLFLTFAVGVLPAFSGNLSFVNDKPLVNQPLGQDQTLLKEKLVARVAKRWFHLKEKNFDKSYEFYSPALRRHVSLNFYKSVMGGSVQWEEARVSSASLESKRAVVIVSVSYRLELPGMVGMQVGEELGVLEKDLKEVWVWKENEWWFVNPMKSKF